MLHATGVAQGSAFKCPRTKAGPGLSSHSASDNLPGSFGLRSSSTGGRQLVLPSLLEAAVSSLERLSSTCFCWRNGGKETRLGLVKAGLISRCWLEWSSG